MFGRIFTDVLLFLGALALTGGLMFISHKKLVLQHRVEYNEVAGYIFAVVAAMYAVTVGFVVVTNWETLNTARTTAEAEANSLQDLYLVSSGLPHDETVRIQSDATSYAQTVLHIEWPQMTKGTASATAWVDLDDISATLAAAQPTDAAQDSALNRSLDRLREVYDARRDRLSLATTGTPGYAWVILIGGGFITVAFTFVFGLTKPIAHAVMVLGLTSVITLLLLFIREINQPFVGVLAVKPDMFEQALERFAAFPIPTIFH